MDWLLPGLIIIGTVALLCFGGVLLFGAPYVPTLTPQVKAALELLELKKGDHLIELGCGDGKVLLAAARQGLKVTGYELNPLLALVAWLRTRRYRHQVKVIWGDFWSRSWPPATAIFTFLHPRFMKRLDTKIIKVHPGGIKLASFAFRVPDRSPAAEKAGVFLYIYQ